MFDLGVSILRVLLLSLGVHTGLTVTRLRLTVDDLRLEGWLSLNIDSGLLVAHLRLNDDLIVMAMMTVRCKLPQSSLDM